MRHYGIIGSVVLGIAVGSWGQQRAGGGAGDEQKLMSELSRRQMRTLLEYEFKKHNIPESQQKVFLTVSSLNQLNEGSNLTRRQQQELVANIAASIDQVLAITGDAKKLMELNAQLVKTGTIRALNTLEYWGDNVRTQGQLRPVAEAIDRVYDTAIKTAQTRSDDLAKQFKDNNDPRVKEWEDLTQLVAMARFNSAFNKYTLALAMDKADPQRAKVAAAGIEILTEYEDPQYEVQAAARGGIAKLNLAKGTTESLEAARKYFAMVLGDAAASWNLKFEAVYFTAVTDLVAKDVAGARRRMGEINGWLAKNAPAKEELKKGAEAAVMMLEYRILATEAELSPGGGANEKAVTALQGMMSKRPDLAGIINEQLMARLPENPAVKELSPLLLRAMVQRGDEEIRKPEDQAVDRKVLGQAVAAAVEMVNRVGTQGLTAEDAEICTLELGLFYARLAQGVEAAKKFLEYAEKYRSDGRRLGIAFDNAAAAVAKLKKDRPDDRATAEAYLRFLVVATAPPFNRAEYAFEYARVLLERNISYMQSTYSDAQRKQMLDGAKKAAGLFAKVTDEKKLLHARYFEMLAYNQAIDLMAADSPELGVCIKKTHDLADDVNRILGKETAAPTDQPAKDKLKWFRVRTALLAADLAKHDAAAGREESLKRAISLLSSFEKDVEGMPNASSLLGEALFIRVNALMSLRRSDEALDNLGRFLETRLGDEGIRIVYEMLENLNKEFLQAQQDKNEGRMAELAGHRAKVSGYLVDRVAKSKSAELVKLLPRYRIFEAGALQQAAILEKDEGKQKGYLQKALSIYEAAMKASPGDNQIRFNVAMAQFDLADYASAQPVLVQLLVDGKVGKPKKPVMGPEGERMVDNDSYWDAMYRLLRCNVELANAKAAGYEPVKLMEETQLKLKQLYIQWGEPGGMRWVGKFEELRKEILGAWEVPVIGETQPAGK
ncbi:MAG: hypothetical protein NTU53_12865 [Planctomycetota bacterium]|nr:hypothetical protein [Planctomycetota bacterium]